MCYFNMNDKNLPYWWLNEESKYMLERGYLLEGQSVEEKIDKICKYAASFYPKEGGKLYKDFKEMIEMGWTSLSSPIWANFGEDRGLDISCFSAFCPDFMEGILDTFSEVVMQTKLGGGTSGYFSKLRPLGSPLSTGGTSSGAMSFITWFDDATKVVSQGSSRRGAFAAYLDIEHPEIKEFLRIKDRDYSIQTINNAVCVGDEWMQSMIDGDSDKRNLWANILKSRREKGIPYLFFKDAANNKKPQIYKDRDLEIYSSNLCMVGTDRVVSNLGYLTAKELHEKDVELTLFDGEKPVKASKMKLREKNVDVYKMTLENGMEQTLTKYHVVPTISNRGDVIKKSLEDVEVSDEVFIQVNKGLFGAKRVDTSIANIDPHSVPPDIWQWDEHSQVRWLSDFMWLYSSYSDSNGVTAFLNDNLSHLRDLQLLYSNLGYYTEVEDNKLTIDRKTDTAYSKVKSIEYAGKEDVYCPEVYTDEHIFVSNGVLTGNCNEIYLPTSEKESFVCCLLSLNLATYDQWKDTDTVARAVKFLDVVMQDFINKSKKIPALKKAHRFAERHRALGIGVLGWHSYLQQNMIPFDSMMAQNLNNLIFQKVRNDAYMESIRLGQQLGYAPIFDEGETTDTKRRHTTLLALAPTTSSSSILGQVSPSIEPYASNYFVAGLAKGSFPRKNKELQKLLTEKGKNTDDVWRSIVENKGSVQHLSFLTDGEKEVFKTFREISPLAILRQASGRQRYIDQGQSINLKIPDSLDIKEINKIHIEAWRLGLKGLYYQRGTSVAKEAAIDLMKCSTCEG